MKGSDPFARIEFACIELSLEFRTSANPFRKSIKARNKIGTLIFKVLMIMYKEDVKNIQTILFDWNRELDWNRHRLTARSIRRQDQ